jgi:hypothetical protein
VPALCGHRPRGGRGMIADEAGFAALMKRLHGIVREELQEAVKRATARAFVAVPDDRTTAAKRSSASGPGRSSRFWETSPGPSIRRARPPSARGPAAGSIA